MFLNLGRRASVKEDVLEKKSQDRFNSPENEMMKSIWKKDSVSV